MFEQAVLASGPSGRRVWMTSAGMLGQALLVTAAIAGSLLWPEALPKVQAILLSPPVPVGAPPTQVAMRPKTSAAPAVPRFDISRLTQPTIIPTKIGVIEDLQLGEPVVGGGLPVGAYRGIGDIIAMPGMRAPEPPSAVEKPKVVEKTPEPVTILRVRTGGNVLPPKLLHQVQPLYPLIAKTARVSGTVQLAGVIGADGRVKELRIVSGPGLLTKAALDAVAQWTYEPTRLNGQTVEVITNITVMFKLD